MTLLVADSTRMDFVFRYLLVFARLSIQFSIRQPEVIF